MCRHRMRNYSSLRVRPKTANPPKVNLIFAFARVSKTIINKSKLLELRIHQPKHTQTIPNTCRVGPSESANSQISGPCWSRDFAPLPGSNDMWPTGEASAHLRWRQNHRIVGTLECIASHKLIHRWDACYQFWRDSSWNQFPLQSTVHMIAGMRERKLLLRTLDLSIVPFRSHLLLAFARWHEAHLSNSFRIQLGVPQHEQKCCSLNLNKLSSTQWFCLTDGLTACHIQDIQSSQRSSSTIAWAAMCWPSRRPAEGVAEKAWQGLCDVHSYTTRRLVVEFFQVL